MKMESCPFCNHEITEQNIVPSGIFHFQMENGRSHYGSAGPGGVEGLRLSCPGCGAEMLADTREDLLQRWNAPETLSWVGQETPEAYEDVPPDAPKLERCPLCRFDPLLGIDDAFHRNSIGWKLIDGVKTYFSAVSPEFLSSTHCYVASCPETAGGCGLSIEGDSRELTIVAWNTRLAGPNPRPLKIAVDE